MTVTGTRMSLSGTGVRVAVTSTSSFGASLAAAADARLMGMGNESATTKAARHLADMNVLRLHARRLVYMNEQRAGDAAGSDLPGRRPPRHWLMLESVSGLTRVAQGSANRRHRLPAPPGGAVAWASSARDVGLTRLPLRGQRRFHTGFPLLKQRAAM